MAVFSKVSAGLAQISETSRFRDRDKTETLAIRDQDQGAETRDLQKMVLRPRPRPRPGLETTTLDCVQYYNYTLQNYPFSHRMLLSR